MFGCRAPHLYCLCTRVPCLVEVVNSATLLQKILPVCTWCQASYGSVTWKVLSNYMWGCDSALSSNQTICTYKILKLIGDCIVPGIKGVTGRGHIVMMDGMLWKGHAHRATIGMTNTTQVLRSLASLAANTHHGGLTMRGYEARTVDETVMPILAEY